MNKQEALWQELCDWLNRWFHEPDLEGLKICLCAMIAHYYVDEDSFWLLVIGNSGSGKSEIVATAISALPDTHIIGSLSLKCLLSGMRDGKEEPSMLTANGTSQIWIAKDFGTFSSIRPDIRAELASYMREVSDGYFAANTGAGRKEWKGKASCIALATPVFEDSWSMLRQLGERFVTVRWRHPTPGGIARKRRLQAGHKTEIRERLKELVGQLFRGRWNGVGMPESDEMTELDAAGEVVTQLQATVTRTQDMRRAVRHRPTVATEGRIGFCFSQLVRVYRAVFGDAVGGVELAKRLARDTIPVERREILECIPPESAVSYQDLEVQTRIPRTTLKREIEELCWLDVLEFPEATRKMRSGDEWNSKMAWLHPEFKARLDRSGLRLHETAQTDKVVTLKPQRKGHRVLL